MTAPPAPRPGTSGWSGRALVLATTLALVTTLPMVVHAQDLPEYTCQRAPAAPRIDGRSDEAVWSRAAPVRLVDVRSVTGVEHPRATEARLLWDDTALYILIAAVDPDVWASLSQRDAALYKEEVVEVFIDPDGDGRNYVEIEVNPLDTVFDLLVTRALSAGGRGLPEWSPTALRAAVAVDGTLNDPGDEDRGWTVEMALPWEALRSDLLDVPGRQSLPPRPGDTWRLNLYRYERPRDAGGVASGPVQYSAWSPVGRIDFHVPERFGVVRFAGAGTAVEGATWGTVKRAGRAGSR